MSTNFSAEKLATLNSVSNCFCLAKWLQVTVDLANGLTHSCHHPLRHRIPLDELAANPGSLHNTHFKKQQRRMMLEGQRPSECSYCWDMEDLGQKYSDRYIKSTDPWAWPHLEEIRGLDWQADVLPQYLEVMLDNVCNFSCAYCMADISTSVAQEMRQHGPYPVSAADHRMPRFALTKEQAEPYAKAFEVWFPQIAPTLKVLRITGGEPLLSLRFWTLLAKLLQQKNSTLRLAINSHLNHDEKTMDRFISEIQKGLQQGSLSQIEIYVSLDTFGARAEYIRHGLQYDRVINNIKKLADRLPSAQIIVMCTFNILSISSFSEWLRSLAILKKKVSLSLDISYLKNPSYLRADILDSDLAKSLKNALATMEELSPIYSSHEIGKLKNLTSWALAGQENPQIEQFRSDFYRFINEYDRRKNKNFLNIFPDYRDFYVLCKKSAFLKTSQALSFQPL